jgi:thymidine phosphorylase
VREALADGRAMDKWRAMIAAQGGDVSAPLPVARETETVVAPEAGVLTSLDAYAVGVAVHRLGAGRVRKEDSVQAAAGIEIHVKPGEQVSAGQPLFTLHTDTPERFARAQEALKGGWTVGPERAGVGVVGDALAGAVRSVAAMDVGSGTLIAAAPASDKSVVLDRIG